MAFVIAISNQKGGVGKTTTAINLASCLAAFERRTLLLDLDPQANSTSGVGQLGHQISIYDVLVRGACFAEAVHVIDDPYLHIAPASQDLVGAEVELVNVIGREQVLGEALASVRLSYDYIIIDCPPALGILTLNALTAADGVIVPVQCEYFAMEGLAHLLQTLGRVKARLNPRLRVETVLLTMHDRRNNLCRQVEADVRAELGDRVFDVVIPRNVKLSEAPSHGKPIILYDIRCAGATAYLSLAQRVIAGYEGLTISDDGERLSTHGGH